MNQEQPAGGDIELNRQERLRLSYRIFSDPAFRQRLFSNPTVAAASIGMRMPSNEHAELLHYKDKILAYGQAIDTLVSLGKDVKTLWKSPVIGVLTVNGIAAPGDWDPNFPEEDEGKVSVPLRSTGVVTRLPQRARRRSDARRGLAVAKRA